MKKKRYFRKAVFLILLYAGALFVTVLKIQTAFAAQETYLTLLDTKVGRYRLNYTGSTNHYTTWTPDGIAMGNVIYNDTNGPYANSSTARLSPSAGAERIRYAFLVWETRAPQGATETVVFLTPDGGRHTLRAAHAVNDFRVVGNNPGITSMFCMAADVTSIVNKSGYGVYSVCNIPRWEYGQGGDRTGGESPGSWQLIVVEEGDSLPVRAVTLKMGAKFYLAKDFGMELALGSGLKSKSVGTAGGQVFFGASNASTNAAMHEMMTAYDGSGTLTGQVHSNTTRGPGLYQNGTLVNSRDSGNGCIRMSLSDIAGIGNLAERISLTVQNNAWTTSFLLGMSVDIAYPDYIGEQKTTVNGPGSVTVTGSFTNTAQTPATGIYGGKLVVTLADGLAATDATAVIDKTTTTKGKISGNTVIFEGSGISSVMNGSSIGYTVECTAGREGITEFYNSAAFHGYLAADGVQTGYWIDRMWTSDSRGVPRYTVTAGCGKGIASVSGAGEYDYGSTVTLQASVKPGYHWVGWSGSYSSAALTFQFPMPAGSLSLTAEGEANTYTIVFDPNDGKEETPVADLVTQYDKEEILPDGALHYRRYTIDGADVTEDVLAGRIPAADAPAAGPPPGETPGEEGAEPGSGETPGEEEAEPGSGETPGEEETEPGSGETPGEEETEPEEPQKAYPSVFVGWATEEGKSGYIPQWKAGDPVVGLTEEDHGMVTLYAVWDDCPWITAADLYYTLEQAKGGFITEAELLSHTAASDREDGSPIAPGIHENGTAFYIPDYTAEDFTQFEHEGSCTENLTVTDSAGNTYQKQLVVHIVDTAAVAVRPEGTTRFIDEGYYQSAAEAGGLEENSLWRTEAGYRQTLTDTFDRIRNDNPVATYQFAPDTLQEMRAYVWAQDTGKWRDPAALRAFYDRFMAPALK